VPGIHLAFHTTPLSADLLQQAMGDLGDDACLTVERLLDCAPLTLVFSGHEGYPRHFVEYGSLTFLIEGMIYNRSDVEIARFLASLDNAYQSQRQLEPLVKDFVDTSDGDFIVVVYAKTTAELFVFNDRWARLPCYYYRSDNLLIVSRNLGFILHWLPSIELDRMAVAEFLIFEYVLGFKTFFRYVTKLRPASLLYATLNAQRLVLDLHQMFEVVFGGSSSRLSEEAALATCEQLFMTSLIHRVQRLQEWRYPITADVTGGYDSRAIVTGLTKLNADVDYYTDDLDTNNESTVAQQLADLYGLKLLHIHLSEPRQDIVEMGRLTYITDGIIDCWASQFVEYKALTRKKRLKPAAARLMGFGGEFIRHPFQPPLFYRSVLDIIKDDVFSQHLDVVQACAVLNVHVDSLMAHFDAYFQEYQENNLNDQCKHFYFEYYNTLVNAGENRHRRHSWTVQPLWSKDLCSFEMQQLSLKMLDYAFFKKFLGRLDPRALTVPIFKKGIKRGSKLSALHVTIKPTLKRLAYNRYMLRRGRKIQSLLLERQTAVLQPLTALLLQEIDRLQHMAGYLDRGAIGQMLEKNCRVDRVYILLTVVLYFGEIERRFSSKIH
jgi:hypothetical protein